MRRERLETARLVLRRPAPWGCRRHPGSLCRRSTSVRRTGFERERNGRMD